MNAHHDEPSLSPSEVAAWNAGLRHDPVYGMCTNCGAVEVALSTVTGTRDLSGIGEHHAYPVGYGCEVCD